jgi:type IV secretory pathway VirB4 component
VFLDEDWKLMEAPGGGAAIENLARRFRKRRTALWMASQGVGEFLDSPDGRRILSVVGKTFLMEQRPVEA